MRKRFFFVFIIATALIAFAYLLLMPDVSKLRRENPGKTSFMKYREREAEKKGNRYRIDQTWVPLSRISAFLVKGVLIAEDDKFWKHEGFDYESMQKALEKDIKTKKFKLGGSTITQQLAKNLYLWPAKNPARKLIEAIITWRLESVLTKKRILELYLNVVEWGEGVFGAEAAARHYFGKASSDLSPEEAARLAAILPNPRKYDPRGNQRYVVNRSNLIYSIMVKRGIVIPDYKEVTEGSDSSAGIETNPSYIPIEKLRPSN